MTTTVRDPWADARAVATHVVLDDEVAAVRRRLWFRRVLGLVLGLVAFLAAYALVQRLVGPDVDELWTVSRHALGGGAGLLGVGIVLVVLGTVRTTGAGRTFVEPADLLSRADRAWLRAQVHQRRAVPDERRPVVADAARRMLVEGRYTPTYLGQALLYVGGVVAMPFPAVVVAFSVLAAWSLVRVVRGLVWSRRARRWLALNP